MAKFYLIREWSKKRFFCFVENLLNPNKGIFEAPCSESLKVFEMYTDLQSNRKS